MLIPRLCLSRAAVAGGAWDSVPVTAVTAFPTLLPMRPVRGHTLLAFERLSLLFPGTDPLLKDQSSLVLASSAVSPPIPATPVRS